MRKTPLKKIGRKKEIRLLEKKYETTIFKALYEKTGNICQLTYEPIEDLYGNTTNEPCAFHFAHLLAKGLYPEHRLNPNNIIIVKNQRVHKLVDRLMKGKKKMLDDILRSNPKEFSKRGFLLYGYEESILYDYMSKDVGEVIEYD